MEFRGKYFSKDFSRDTENLTGALSTIDGASRFKKDLEQVSSAPILPVSFGLPLDSYGLRIVMCVVYVYF